MAIVEGDHPAPDRAQIVVRPQRHAFVEQPSIQQDGVSETEVDGRVEQSAYHLGTAAAVCHELCRRAADVLFRMVDNENIPPGESAAVVIADLGGVRRVGAQ